MRSVVAVWLSSACATQPSHEGTPEPDPTIVDTGDGTVRDTTGDEPPTTDDTAKTRDTGERDTHDTGAATPPALDAIVTYDGGTDTEQIRDVFLGEDGSIVITGGTGSVDFPVTPDAVQATHGGSYDVFVQKWDATGTLVFSTFLGGPNYDRAYAVEVDDAGDIYLTGRAGDGFPTTRGALQETFGGDVNPSPVYGAQDGFVVKLSGDGALLWSTYVGGDDQEAIRDLDVDAAHDVFLAVCGTSRTWPYITKDAFQPAKNSTQEGIVMAIASDGATVRYASYIGGNANDGGTPSVRVTEDGTAYFLLHTQSDDFPVTPGVLQTRHGGDVDLVLAAVSPEGALEWATYLGGSGTEFTETHGLALTADGRLVVGATTTSADLTTTVGAFQTTFAGLGGSTTGANTNYSGDGYVALVRADGTAIDAATYFGGSAGEGIEGISLDRWGNIYVSGASYSADLPLTADARQPFLAGESDLFFARLSPDLSAVGHASLLGGSGEDNARCSHADPWGRLVVGGESFSTDFPTLASSPQPAFGGGTGDGVWALLLETAP